MNNGFNIQFTSRMYIPWIRKGFHKDEDLITSIQKYVSCNYEYKKIMLERISSKNISVSSFFKLVNNNNLSTYFLRVEECNSYKFIRTFRGDMLLISGDIICGYCVHKINKTVRCVINDINKQNVE